MPVVGVKKTAIIAVLFSLFLLGSTLGLTFASSGNWVEVARLTGVGGIGTTETFTIEHVDWRIRWEIETSNGSERTAFLVYIFPITGIHRSEPWFESIQHFGTEETSGMLYIYNHSGSFNMDVLASIESYTMIIEQNLESIPEFPSWTPMLIMLLAVMAVAVIYKRKLQNQERRN